MARFLGLGMLAALVAAGALAQHPDLGADRPAPDPRYKAPREIHSSDDRTFEMVQNTQAERCAIRIVGWRERRSRNFVDTWIIGVEKSNRPATAFIELRVIDETDTPLAIENPTLYLQFTGPTKDWRFLPMTADGFVRLEKPLRDMSRGERFGFLQVVEDRLMRELAFTVPNGGGDVYVSLSHGAVDRQYAAYVNCICATLDGAERRLLRCD
ncbi:MAG: hypothetical protein ACKO1J_08750 [Tagaea sp.]